MLLLVLALKVMLMISKKSTSLYDTDYAQSLVTLFDVSQALL